MHRLQKPEAVLTAAIYQTDTGRELRIGFSLTNLIHSELSRTGDAPLLARAADLRQVFAASKRSRIRHTSGRAIQLIRCSVRSEGCCLWTHHSVRPDSCRHPTLS